MSVGPKHALEFPDGFDDFAWETESKGWLSGVIAIVDGRCYQVTFYDPIRLAQDIETELERSALPLAPHPLPLARRHARDAAQPERCEMLHSLKVGAVGCVIPAHLRHC